MSPLTRRVGKGHCCAGWQGKGQGRSGTPVDRRGMTFIEIAFSSAILIVLVLALTTLLSGGMHQTRAGADEMFGSLYLAELAGQVSGIPYEQLMEITEPVDVTAPGRHVLGKGSGGPVIQLSRMRPGFVRRTVAVLTADDIPGHLKEIHLRVTSAPPGGQERNLDQVLHVGRLATDTNLSSTP